MPTNLLSVPLTLNATVSDGRITISFSHKASARYYNNYLKNLTNSFYKEHECEIAESEDEVSMKLPSGIITEPQKGPKDVVLVFNNQDEALAWESEMIVWERKSDQAEKKRLLSRSFTVESFEEKMMLLGVHPVERHNVFAGFSVTQNISEVVGSKGAIVKMGIFKGDG